MKYTTAKNKLKKFNPEYKIKERILVCINEPDECIGLEVSGFSPLGVNDELKSIIGLLPTAMINWMPNDGYILIQLK
jgi:hypothetical protein